MSLRSLGTLAAILIALGLIYSIWPRGDQPSTINSPAPRAPAAIPRKLDRILPLPAGGKAAVRLPDAPQALEPAANRNESMLERFRLGKNSAVAVANESFEILKLKAVPAADYRAELGEKITEKLGFVIFSSRGAFGEITGDGALPVVAKKSNGMLGIVTGTVIVRLKESSLALSVAESYELTLKYIDDDLRIAYYSATSKISLNQLVQLLKKDSAVETVNLEIVNSKKKL